MLEVKNPGKKIKETCASLGQPYKIVTMDLENVIYRNLGNGYDFEVSKGQVIGYVEHRDEGDLVWTVDLLSGGSFVLPKAVKFEDKFETSATKYNFK